MRTTTEQRAELARLEAIVRGGPWSPLPVTEDARRLRHIVDAALPALLADLEAKVARVRELAAGCQRTTLALEILDVLDGEGVGGG